MILKYSIAEGYTVRAPERKTKGSAGIDLHIPEFTPRFLEDFGGMNRRIAAAESSLLNGAYGSAYYVFGPIGEIILPPHSRAIIPSGLRFEIPEGWMLEGANRGSVSSIQGVIHGAHIIDCDYQGVVFMSIINTSNSLKHFLAGDSLLQVMLREAPPVVLVQVPEDSLYLGKTSERGEGALGSTDGDEHGGN